nr:MAG TPA: hypothetical protein [Caudoviricetes sp.]
MRSMSAARSRYNNFQKPLTFCHAYIILVA